MVDELRGSIESSRRAVLAGVGAGVGGIGFIGRTLATNGHSSSTDPPSIVFRQGNRCVPVAPFTGEQSVEEMYDYRIPARYVSEENGGTDPGSGPYYSSAGTTHLQQDGASLLFLYAGPNGLSLVVVHGSTEPGPSGGGSATFEFAALPDDGAWVVRDDHYVDPETGEIAQTNYDDWDIGGEPQSIDWTWADGRTDGGAFRGLTGTFSITIDPAFNEDATLFGEQYDGTIQSWQLLTPDSGGVTRLPLDLGAPVTIETGSCDSQAPPSQRDVHVETVEFKGCGEVRFVFEGAFEGAREVAVETTTGWQSAALRGDDLQRVPGQFGDSPLVKWRVHGNEKILAVETAAGITDNPHQCAQAGANGGEPDGDDRESGTENEHDESGNGADRDEAGNGNENDEDAAKRKRPDDDDEEKAGGPPSDAGPPEHSGGPPENGGPPDHAGSPDTNGKKP